MVLKEKKDVKMNMRYQNLWTAFVANNDIVNEYDDVALVRFFQSIQGRYSPNTLWVIYSCLNSRFIDNYGVNLKGLPRFHKYLKQQTLLYVATKSNTLSAKERDTILTYVQDKKNQGNFTISCNCSPLFWTLEVHKMIQDG